MVQEEEKRASVSGEGREETGWESERERQAGREIDSDRGRDRRAV